MMILATSMPVYAESLPSTAPIAIEADENNRFANQMIVVRNVVANKKTVFKKGEIVTVLGTDAKKANYWVARADDLETVYKVAAKNVTFGKVAKISGLPKSITLKVGQYKKVKWKINSPVFIEDFDFETSNDEVCTLNDGMLDSNEMILCGEAKGTCTVTFTPMYGNVKATIKVTVK